MSNLQLLFLQENQFDGSIPIDIGNSTNLEEIWLNNNLITGNIPSSITNSSSIIALGLNDNNLSGTIPDFAASMASIEWAFVENNNFDAINNISTSAQFSHLSLQQNNLTFSDLEPVFLSTPSSFNYNVQDSIDNSIDTTISQGSSITFSVSDIAPSNLYQWTLNGTSITGANSSSYNISSALPSDDGEYYM